MTSTLGDAVKRQSPRRITTLIQALGNSKFDATNSASAGVVKRETSKEDDIALDGVLDIQFSGDVKREITKETQQAENAAVPVKHGDLVERAISEEEEAADYLAVPPQTGVPKREISEETAKANYESVVSHGGDVKREITLEDALAENIVVPTTQGNVAGRTISDETALGELTAVPTSPGDKVSRRAPVAQSATEELKETLKAVSDALRGDADPGSSDEDSDLSAGLGNVAGREITDEIALGELEAAPTSPGDKVSRRAPVPQSATEELKETLKAVSDALRGGGDAEPGSSDEDLSAGLE